MPKRKLIPFSEQYVVKPGPYAGALDDIRSDKQLTGEHLAYLVERYPDPVWPARLIGQLTQCLRGNSKPSRGRKPMGEPSLDTNRRLSSHELARIVESLVTETWPAELRNYLLRYLRQQIPRRRGRPAQSEAGLDFTLYDADSRYQRALSKIKYCQKRQKALAKRSRRAPVGTLGRAASRCAYEIALRLLQKEEDRIARGLTDERRRHFTFYFRNVDARRLQNALSLWRKGKRYRVLHDDPDEGPDDF